jgi:drug/metabolite transporter (DMT)-like permease
MAIRVSPTEVPMTTISTARSLLPLFALLLAALSARFAVLRHEEARLRLVLIAGCAYGCLFFLLLWQALRGQSLVRPDAVTLAVLGVLAVTAIGAAVAALSPSRQPAS